MRARGPKRRADRVGQRQGQGIPLPELFDKRLQKLDFHVEGGGRNTYPDFSLVEVTEGYEIKGLAWPGRERDYDSNSQVPTGFHNGRQVFYVFGRYPPT